MARCTWWQATTITSATGTRGPDKLLSRCRERGIGCDIIPQVTRDGITVSSTYIRTLIESGQMERPPISWSPPLPDPHRHPRLPLRPHHRHPHGEPDPAGPCAAAGAGRVCDPVFLPDGASVPGVTNIGTRPTVSDGDAVSVETFLLDFDGDLYDKTIRVEFCRRLRPERRFASPRS